MTVQVRFYQNGDEKRILDLFQICFKKPMSLEYWTWRFKDNPFQNIQAVLAFEGEKLIAHYAVSPLEFEVDGRLVLGAHSMTTMTHPDYQGRGLFNLLANELYIKLKNENFHFVWGFPNANSYPGFMKNLGWKPLDQFPTLKCNTHSTAEESLQFEKSSLAFTSSDLEKFNIKKTQVARTEKYYKWRFELNPEVDYTFWKFMIDKEVVGLAVTKNYESEVDLVEILAIKERSFVDVVNTLKNCLFIDEGKSAVNAWMNIHHPFYLQMLKAKFVPVTPLTYMGIAFFKNENARVLSDITQWYYNMGDSDVF